MFEPVLIRPCLENYPVPPVSTPWKGTDQTIDPGTFYHYAESTDVTGCQSLPSASRIAKIAIDYCVLLHGHEQFYYSCVSPLSSRHIPGILLLRKISEQTAIKTKTSLSSSGAILLTMLLSSKQPRQKNKPTSKVRMRD